jgi:hypothetical protein
MIWLLKSCELARGEEYRGKEQSDAAISLLQGGSYEERKK